MMIRPLLKGLAALLFLSGFTFTFYGQQEYKVVVLPMEAIPDSAQLSHGEFRRQYPGIDVTNFGLTDEGWYIRYSHQGLIYMFGPSSDLDYTREMKAILEQIRLSVVLKNPKLSSSKLEIVKFEFEAMGGNSGPVETRVDSDESQ